MKSTLLHAVAAIGIAAATGCAPAVEPIRVRSADLASLPDQGGLARPIIVEFAEGDVIPIALTFTGDLLELTPAAPQLAFRARRRFWVRVSGDGLAVSTDGVHFGERPREPGSFRLGLSVKREGTRVEVDVKTPTHARTGG